MQSCKKGDVVVGLTLGHAPLGNWGTEVIDTVGTAYVICNMDYA